MKKSRKLTTYALGSCLMLAASAQAEDWSFTSGEGFTNGTLAGQLGWTGGGSFDVDISGDGQVNSTDMTNVQWETAFPSNSVDALAYNTFTVSNVVSWSQAITNGDNSIFNVMLNDEKSGGSPVRLSLEKRSGFADEYVITLKSDDGTQKGWKNRNESLFGLDQLTDPDSDEIGFGFTVVKGINKTSWTYSYTLRNLTTDSEIWTSGGDFSVSSNFHASATLYAGISSGVKVEQNGATNRVTKSFTFEQSYVAPTFKIVQWGHGTDIVTNDVNSAVESKTYAAGVVGISQSDTPPVYYTNNVGKSPEFNFAGNGSAGGTPFLAIDDWWQGDRIQVSLNKANQQSMVVWEDFLTDNSLLQTVSIEIQGYGNAASWSNGNYRILIEKGSGLWYASNPTDITHNSYSSGTAQTVSNMTWYSYTPHSGGNPTIAASAATIDMDDVTSVGYYVEVNAKGTHWIGSRCQAFSATASPGSSSSTVLQWGNSGGDTNIVTATSVDFASEPKNYVDGVEINPAVDASYYPNNTDRSPVFNGALFGGTSGSGSIRDSSSGDYLQLTDNLDEHEAMIAWETFLETPTKITGLSTEIYGHGTSNGVSTLRFVVKQDGAWYASDAQTFDKDTYTSISIDAAATSWYDFTPLSGGTGIVGSVTSLSLTNVASAGYYVDTLMDGVVWNGTRIRYFRVAGFVAPPSVDPYEAWIAENGVIGGKNDDDDGDSLSNWGEYVFGGDPVPPNGALDQGSQPVLDVATGAYTYYTINSEDGLFVKTAYTLNLVSGPWTTGTAVSVTSGTDDGTFYVDSADFSAEVAAEEQLFIKLIVE